MKVKYSTLLTLVAVVLCLHGGVGLVATAQAADVIVTETNNDQIVTLAPNQTLVINLAENHSTVNRWSLIKYPRNLLRLMDDRFVLDGSHNRRIGAYGRHEFRFEPIRTGNPATPIVIESWGLGDLTPDQTYTVYPVVYG